VREGVELQKMSFVEIVVLHMLILFDIIVGLPIVYQFNKGGNCKLQGGLFIFIGLKLNIYAKKARPVYNVHKKLIGRHKTIKAGLSKDKN
jgi:hypothetical protein